MTLLIGLGGPSWEDVSWEDIFWADVFWEDYFWEDVILKYVSWVDVSWEDVSWEVSLADICQDVCKDDVSQGTLYPMSKTIFSAVYGRIGLCFGYDA